jgi:hypothetical protein
MRMKRVRVQVHWEARILAALAQQDGIQLAGQQLAGRYSMLQALTLA